MPAPNPQGFILMPYEHWRMRHWHHHSISGMEVSRCQAVAGSCSQGGALQ